MYVIEFFNSPASKGETVFAGSKLESLSFLAMEAETLLYPKMQERADEFRAYVQSIPVPQDDICWSLETDNEDDPQSSAYYVFSKCVGKRAKKFADN